MLLYVTRGTNDLTRSARFYDAVLAALGYERRVTEADEIGYAAAGDRRCRLWVTKPYDGKGATFGNGTTVAIEAPSRAAVDAFHKAGLANGGADEGAPGLRPFHPDFYAAFVRDPEGNKLAAVCERAE